MPNRNLTDPLDVISQFEDQRQNVNVAGYGQPGVYPTGVSHASGYWQVQPDTWNKYAPGLGIGPASADKPAGSFSRENQIAVAKAIYKAEGFAPWARNNPRLAQFIASKPAGYFGEPGIGFNPDVPRDPNPGDISKDDRWSRVSKPLPTKTVPATATAEASPRDARWAAVSKPLPTGKGATGDEAVRPAAAAGGGGTVANPAYRGTDQGIGKDLEWLGVGGASAFAGVPGAVLRDLPAWAGAQLENRFPSLGPYRLGPGQTQGPVTSQDVLNRAAADPGVSGMIGRAIGSIPDPTDLQKKWYGPERMPPATGPTGRIGQEVTQGAGAGAWFGVPGMIAGGIGGGLAQGARELGISEPYPTVAGLLGPTALGRALGAGTRLVGPTATRMRELADRMVNDFHIPASMSDFAGSSAMGRALGRFGISPMGPKLQAVQDRVLGMVGGDANGAAITGPDGVVGAQTRINGVLRGIEGRTNIPVTGTQAEGELNALIASSQNNPEMQPLIRQIQRVISNSAGTIPGEEFGKLMSNGSQLEKKLLNMPAGSPPSPGSVDLARGFRDWLTRGFEASATPGDAAAYRAAKGQEAAAYAVGKAMDRNGVINPSKLQGRALRFDPTNNSYQADTLRDIRDLGEYGANVQQAAASGETRSVPMFSQPGLTTGQLLLGGGAIGAGGELVGKYGPDLVEKMVSTPGGHLAAAAGLGAAAATPAFARMNRAFGENPATLQALAGDRGFSVPGLGTLGGLIGGAPNPYAYGAGVLPAMNYLLGSGVTQP